MFLLKLLRFLFRNKKRDMASIEKPYTLQYSNQVIRFFDPVDKKWAEKNKKTLQPWAIEKRKQAFCYYDRATIWDAIVGPNLEKPRPVIFN